MNLNSRINTLIMRGLSATEAREQAEREARLNPSHDPETYERAVERQATRTSSPIVRTTGRPFMTILAEALEETNGTD